MIAKLGASIPELKPLTPEDDPEPDPLKKQTDDTSKRIIEMKKEKLKNLKMKHDNSLLELDISGTMTDVEKDRTTRKDKITKNFGNRNLSIDKIRKVNEASIDRTTQNLKDKIKKNLEAMKVSNPKTRKIK